jgi:hypothetical protein
MLKRAEKLFRRAAGDTVPVGFVIRYARHYLFTNIPVLLLVLSLE